LKAPEIRPECVSSITWNEMSRDFSPDPVPLLQALIRFDTSNPPGNESQAVSWARQLLSEGGIQSTILARQPDRPNLVARLQGRGDAPPLLLFGHLDVVGTADQRWQQDPFGGELLENQIWGRGTLDMKAGIAMFLAACLRAKADNLSLAGDAILVLLADEEMGSDYGANFLVEEHPGLFEGVRYAISEFGGFSYPFAGQRLYPIMVSEKQICHLRAIVRGPAGHGSLNWRGGTMARLASFLGALDRNRLPVHITPPLRLMVGSLAEILPTPFSMAIRNILSPRLAAPILASLGESGLIIESLLRNTATPTMVQGGEQINVIPCEIQVGLDGRLLPGFSPQELLQELRDISGDEVEFVVERHDPGPENVDMQLFPMLAEIIRQVDPGGCPFPLLLPGVSDARFFARLGIQTYGFIPMNLPDDFEFMRLVHAADERIPVEAVHFGTHAIFQALVNYRL
jgi:acetylornithine deacetylase/succinyl-diaminopimelate desuccinylase-like protein